MEVPRRRPARRGPTLAYVRDDYPPGHLDLITAGENVVFLGPPAKPTNPSGHPYLPGGAAFATAVGSVACLADANHARLIQQA